MRRITREHYRDFVGTLNVEIAKLEGKMLVFEHYDDKRAESGEEWDMEDYREYREAWEQQARLESVRKIMQNEVRWVEFDSKELLEVYVDSIGTSYQCLDGYSRQILPVDGGETRGVTSDEWDRLEMMRSELRWHSIAWDTFAEFCESGEIL